MLCSRPCARGRVVLVVLCWLCCVGCVGCVVRLAGKRVPILSLRSRALFNTPPGGAAPSSIVSTTSMANPVWAQVVRDVCARKPADEEPQQSVQEDADFEEPLFASHTPANGLTPALQAIAAIIDEDDVRPEPSRPTKRKAESLGEAQVCLALTGLGAGSAQPQRQRQRVQTATRMQP